MDMRDADTGSSGAGSTPPVTVILDDIRAEAERLATSAIATGVPVRLMGGLAVWLRAPSVRRPPFAREYADLDFAADSGARSVVRAFFEGQGYVPEKLFNALHGAQRLNYAAPDARWTIDVIFDVLSMSHRLDLRESLASNEPTISLADLLLTKLQIWEINRKDLGDILCLLADHPLGESGGETIDLRRLRAILGSDWGFAHTVERNLGKVVELWSTQPVAGARFDVAAQVKVLRAEIDAAPKSLAWKTRAKIGERLRWYETPDEVRH
jgi:hypothetical protein